MKFTRDINGNKRIKVGKFSIQTLGNLPRVHAMSKEDLEDSLMQGIVLNDVREYIIKYGTKRQKELLGIKY